MAIAPGGWRMSQVEGCIRTAATYRLSEADAREIVDRQITVINEEWDDVCDQASMTTTDRGLFWHRAVLHPYALQESA
jgi:serine/threonine-protein kinase HipA